MVRIYTSQTEKVLQELVSLFGYATATPEDIGNRDKKLMVLLYKGKKGDSLTKLRCSRWNEMAVTSSQVNPAILPPTERAAHFHSLRVHLEMLKGTSLELECEVDPCKWGWRRDDGDSSLLLPVMTDFPPAPDHLLNVIRCKCKMTAKNPCGTMKCLCRKNGLECMQACGDCRGDACANQETQVVEEEEELDEVMDGNIFKKWLNL